MFRILVIADSPHSQSGYANQARSFAHRMGCFDKDFEVHFLGQQTVGLPHEIIMDGVRQRYLLWPNHGGDFAEGSFDRRMEQIKPDIIWTLSDSHWHCYINDRNRGKAVWHYWVAVDGFPIVKQQKYCLRNVDHITTFAQFAQRLLMAEGFKNEYIPHGFEPQFYYPLDMMEKETVKRKYGLSGKKVVLSVYRNQPRKVPWLAMAMLDKFMKDKNDIVALHITDPFENPGTNRYSSGWNLMELRERYKLMSKLLFPEDIGVIYNFMEGFSEPEMREIYGMADVFLTPSIGEGFNIPVLLSQACAVPVVASNMTSHPDLLNNGTHGLLIDIDYIQQMEAAVDRYYASVDAGAQALQFYYDNPFIRLEHGIKAREFALKNYNWENTQHMWRKRLLDSLGGKL